MVETQETHADEKVLFLVNQDEDGYPPVKYESLWSRRINESSFLLKNIPFYVCGVSYGDAVSAEEKDGEFIAKSIFHKGGNSTIGLYVSDEVKRNIILTYLSRYKVQYTKPFLKSSLISLNIYKDENFFEIDSYLNDISDGENVACWDMCLQHSGIGESRLREAEKDYSIF